MEYTDYNIHEKYMSRAIHLAQKGLGKVSPNPMVGCVIVKNGKVIGEGFHESFGGQHAEIEAIKNCIEDPSDASIYITLEPCSHHGKTPPCSDVWDPKETRLPISVASRRLCAIGLR